MQVFISKDLIKVGEEEYNNIHITDYDMVIPPVLGAYNMGMPIYKPGGIVINNLRWKTQAGVECLYKCDNPHEHDIHVERDLLE